MKQFLLNYWRERLAAEHAAETEMRPTPDSMARAHLRLAMFKRIWDLEKELDFSPLHDFPRCAR